MDKRLLKIIIPIIACGFILMVVFQNVTLITVEELDSSSVDNFEQIRCELVLESDARLFVVAAYNIETDDVSLIVKMLENSVLEEATLKGTRTHDEDGFVNYITADYVFRFYLEDSLGIPKAKYAILESPNESFDLGNNCIIDQS